MAKKIKTIVCDGDGTSWDYGGEFGSSWSAVSIVLGVKREADELLEKYYHRGEGSTIDWINQHAVLFRGKSVELVKKEIYPVPYTKGFREFIGDVKGRFERGLLTGGLDIVAKKVEEELALNFCFCNSLGRENGNFNGLINYQISLWDKHLIFEKYCKEERIFPEEVCYVGDSKNDVECMKRVGVSIAFNPKDEETKEAADYIISDFRELNNILELGGDKK